MAITLHVETGDSGPDANTYNTLDQWDDYFEGHRYGAALIAATEDEKKAVLVQSFRTLDSAVTLKGEKTDVEQGGEFPRTGLDPIGPDVIPRRWREAQLELARFIFLSDRDRENDGAAVKREKLDVLEVEYQAGATRNLIPDIVQRMIAPFVLVPVTEDTSAPTSSAVFMDRA